MHARSTERQSKSLWPGAEYGTTWPNAPVADDAALIVTEFASNAVLHSLSKVGTFTVRCELFSTYVWVEVEDEGGEWCRPEPDGRPHGLDIVTLLVGAERLGHRAARRTRSSAARRDTTAIRSWARANNITVNDRGRIPAEVVAQYEAANA